MPPTSAPVQKARPSPVTMIARIASLKRSSEKCSRSCWRMSQVRAFSRSGRFNTTLATAPSMRRSTVMGFLLWGVSKRVTGRWARVRPNDRMAVDRYKLEQAWVTPCRRRGFPLLSDEAVLHKHFRRFRLPMLLFQVRYAG